VQARRNTIGRWTFAVHWPFNDSDSDGTKSGSKELPQAILLIWKNLNWGKHNEIQPISR
jgi:hypothetical protein